MTVETVETAAGRALWGVMRMLLVLVLDPVLWRTLPSAAFLEMEMVGRTQRVRCNDNVTIACKISGSPQLDIGIMRIIWFWKSPVNEAEIKLFEFYGRHQEAFRLGAIVPSWRLKKGDASLQLPGVQLREAGEYRCEVVITPEKAQGTVWLQVIACPVSTLFQDPATVKNNEDKCILCKSSWFYPEDINITWYKWTLEDHQYVKFSEGISTGPAVKNENGTFNIEAKVQCERLSMCGRAQFLISPQILNFTLPEIEWQNSTSSWVVIACIGGTLIGLFFNFYFNFLEKAPLLQQPNIWQSNLLKKETKAFMTSLDSVVLLCKDGSSPSSLPTMVSFAM